MIGDESKACFSDHTILVLFYLNKTNNNIINYINKPQVNKT